MTETPWKRSGSKPKHARLSEQRMSVSKEKIKGWLREQKEIGRQIIAESKKIAHEYQINIEDEPKHHTRKKLPKSKQKFIK